MKKSKNQIIGVGVVACLMALASPLSASAHGEEKPGPNGGEIRMPGAFHTEVKKEAGVLRVYLLDVQFQNPTVEKSSVDVRVRNGKSQKDLKCAADKDSFKCDLPKGEALSKGELIVKANRAGMPGSEAVYKLPLLSKAKGDGVPTTDSGHGHHGH